MEEIIDAKKLSDGIVVTFLSGKKAVSEHFSYGMLIQMEINISDLLDHPGYYAIDRNGPRIVRTDFCIKRT